MFLEIAEHILILPESLKIGERVKISEFSCRTHFKFASREDYVKIFLCRTHQVFAERAIT